MKKRTLSMMLALLMAFGVFTVFCPTPVSVASAAEGESNATVVVGKDEYTAVVDAALVTSYKSAQDKLDNDKNMRPAAKYSTYELYINDYTGEMAFKDTVTGQILLSNPYDIPVNATSDAVKAELLSQIELGYTDNGVDKTFFSYTDAAKKGQIKVSNSKNGVLVEYTLGRENANYLAPGRIYVSRMQEQIFANLFPHTIERVDSLTGETEILFDELSDYTGENIMYTMSYYNAQRTEEFPQEAQEARNMRLIYSYYEMITLEQVKNADDKNYNAELAKEYNFITEPIYVRKKEVSTARDLATIEDKIKTSCPNYTLDEMLKDHEATRYVAEEANPPLFKLALQYTLTDEGLTIRLPANSIRFDHSSYSLDYVRPLKYFGAGNLATDDGYLFYPDGGGAILYYDDIAKNATTLNGKVYGIDYAYHQISGKHQETIRLPVFGLVNAEQLPVYDAEGNPVMTTNDIGEAVPLTTTTTSGYFAILEEGDALADITAASNPSSHNYASMFTTFYPRPKDTYDLSGTVTSGSTTAWEVESSRKYTGSYEIHVYMLADAKQQDALQTANRQYFEASYVGMASAYNYYLVNVANVLTPLSASDVQDGQLPLYIEAFGTVPDMQRFLSIPVEVDVPLTTFADVQKMYLQLSTNGISNVQFKLTGFANGGMYSSYPAKLKWMKEVGGKQGFNTLLADAKDKNYGVYPEFDFMYISTERIFDGVSLRTSAARTIDNRYANKRIFDATYQEFVTYYEICVTPVMVEKHYQKFAKTFKEYDPIGLSASTLGSDLNSDFGKKNPTNRDESKQVISSVLEQMAKDYNGKIMLSGGNAYTLKYVQHLLDAALDSSRFAAASRAVPFVGMVLHGYVNFAGSPINMAGNTDYQVLKAIENGASVYFTLSYDNTDLLKQYEDLSQYYAVNYKIWAGTYDEEGNLIETGELFNIYNRVNDAIGHLQTSKIVDHKFLIGERIPTEEEMKNDAALLEKEKQAAMDAAILAAEQELLDQKRQDYLDGKIDAGELIDVKLSDEEVARIKAEVEEAFAAKNTTDSDSQLSADAYVSTKYTMNDGRIVMVTYENGTSFVLNYNIDEVKVIIDGTAYTIHAYDFVTIQ